MYLRKFSIENVRSICRFEMNFERDREAGWHVILGSNGSGKSSVVRAFALLVMGEKEAYAARQDFGRWIRRETKCALIQGTFVRDDNGFDVMAGGGQPPQKPINGAVKIELISDGSNVRVDATFTGERHQRSIWGGAQGWFAASFGPFRRFTGGDRIYDRLFVSNKRLAPHLTALGEDVALTEAMGWLTSLYIQALQDERSGGASQSRRVLEAIVSFINNSSFLPHGAKIGDITNEHVFVVDGNGFSVTLDQLSDGYRSALSLVVELIRQMFGLYGEQVVLDSISADEGVISAPGIVAIDEVDAHLHPTWQKEIGYWLTRSFPRVQFIVTTHSPIVCRAVANQNGEINGSVWRLSAPGEKTGFERIEGDALEQLIFGDVFAAYSTNLFGSNVTRSEVSMRMLERLADLNKTALERELSPGEVSERKRLKLIFQFGEGLE